MKVYTVSERALKRAKGSKKGHFSLNGEPKCGGCNWEQSQLFVLADSQKEADDIYLAGDGGLCGDCLSDLLRDCAHEIKLNPLNQ